MPRVIALTGLAGSGKRTVASLLSIHHGLKLIKFADPMKDMLRSIGLDATEIEGHKKGLPCRLLGGKSPRYAMQTLETDWGRAMISDDLWCNIWKSRAKQFLLDSSPVVVDDCRFANEARAVTDLGGDIWNIKRPASARLGATGGLPGHVSESREASRLASRQINNSGSLDELLIQVNILMSTT